MGGFGKCTGDLPDIFHSYLGLAALSFLGIEKACEGPDLAVPSPKGDDRQVEGQSTMEDEGEDDSIAELEATKLRKLDPTLCTSVRARRFIERLGLRDKG
jgi:prenyltransferase beta subunit